MPLRRGDIVTADAPHWKGKVPPAPEGLLPASDEAWRVWFGAWFSAHWTKADLPGLRQVIRLWDQVERGEFQRASEMRLQMDSYGITLKGQQDRRWRPPSDAAPAATRPAGSPGASARQRYGHLTVARDPEGGAS